MDFSSEVVARTFEAAESIINHMPRIPLGEIPSIQADKHNGWAVRYDDDVLTWRALEVCANRRAWALKDAGVGQQDMVTLALPNGVAFFEWMFALWKIGSTPHVVSSKLPIQELRGIVEIAKPKVIITSQEELAADFEVRSVEFGQNFPREDVLPRIVSAPWKAMSSGGSTGRPKIIVQPIPGYHDTDAPNRFRIPQNETILTTGPLYHNMPVTASIAALCRGSSVVGMTKFDAEQALQLIDKWNVTWASFVPTMMMRISRLPSEVRERFNLSSLKTIWHWASPMPPALKEEWITWFGPENIWELYGGTEGIGTTIIGGPEWLDHRGSVGRPTTDKIRILDDDGKEMPTGAVGEIFALPPGGQGSTYSYIGAVPRSASDGYESLGDYGWMDEDGYLYIADRRTDMIVSGGSNIFPAEVEGALMAHHSVEMAVVIGLPNDDLGAAVHAIVKLVPGAAHQVSTEQLLDFLSRQLVRYKVPRTIEFSDALLRDDAGKVRRQQLREERVATLKA